jgi:hypothetical protein
MLVQSTAMPQLASLHAMGLALASDPRDVLVGFLQPMTRLGKPVWLGDRHFSGAIVYAMTRSHGAITQVTYRIGACQESFATLRPDGDWQIPPCELEIGETRILVTAHTADGQLAQSTLIVVVPAAE